MTTRHHTDGPGGLVRPGPGSGLNDFQAKPANDNRVPRGGALPYARGVVLAMEVDDDATPLVSLHLLLPNGELGVAFHRAAHDFDVIALWRGLGRDFNLPLYLRSEAGELSALSPETSATSHPRRIGSPLSTRRPRFLARRRMPLIDHALADEKRAAEQR